MMRTLRIVGLLAAMLLLVTGCEERVQKTVGDKIKERAEAGNGEIDAMFKERDEEIRTALEEKVGYIQKVQAEKAKLLVSLDRIPSEQEIATSAGLSVDKVKEFGGGDVKEHPLVPWRKSLMDSKVKGELQTREKKYPGTFLENLIPAYFSFMDSQDKYWAESMDMEEYAPFLEAYAKDAMQEECGPGKTCSHSRRCVEGKCAKSPFVDDALFDWVFLHMQHLADANKLPEDTRMTSHLRYWQLALGLESLSREGFKNYIHRLCETYFLKGKVVAAAGELKTKDPVKLTKHLNEKVGLPVNEESVVAALALNTHCGSEDVAAPAFECLGLADEFRAKAVMQPYYDQLICRMDALKKQAPDSPFASAVDAMKEELQRLKQEYPIEKMVEYPVLPETTSMYDASQRLVLEMGPKGVFLGERRDPFKDSTAGRIALTELAEGEEFSLTSSSVKSIREAFLTNLKTLRTEGDPALRQGLISVQSDGSYDALRVLDMATATTRMDEEDYQNTLNQEVWLAGRRKVDGRNARRATQMQLLASDKKMKLNLSNEGSKVACTVVGFTGDAPVDEFPAPVAVAFLDGENVKMGALADSKMETADGTMPNAQFNLAEASKWANGQQGAIVLAVRSGASWNDMLRTLGPLSFKCVDPACRAGEYRTKPNVYISSCN